jgi:lysophospholipase L1-like esterase
MRENQMRYLYGRDKTELSFRRLLIGPLETLVDRYKGQYNRLTYDLNPERAEQVAKFWLDSWMSIKALADRQGADFVAIIQPNPGVGTPNLESLHLETDVLKSYALVYQAARKLLNTPRYDELRPHVIDFSDAFDGEEKFYIDPVHVSPNGNQIIAQKLLDYLDGKQRSETLIQAVNALPESPSA